MNIVVVGAGTMGSGIAYSSAASGHSVTVIEQDQKLLDQGMKRVDEYVQRNLSRGHISKEQASQIHSKVRGSTDFAKACSNADLVVEAVFEGLGIKFFQSGADNEACGVDQGRTYVSGLG